MEAAERDQRQAADALHKADNDLTSIQAAVDGNLARLREMKIAEDETEQHLEQRIDDLKSKAQKYRNAIKESREACEALRIQLEKSRTAVDEGQKRLSSLLETAEQLNRQFQERLAAAGFKDERAYQLAKLPENAMSDIDRQLKDYGERRKSLADQVESLRNKLDGKERIDLTTLEQGQKEYKAKKDTAEAIEAALTKKLALHEDALKEIQSARRQRKRKEEHWAVVRDLYNCCAGIAGGNRRAKMTFEAYVQQYYFKQATSG